MDPYQVLGVPRNASPELIKQRYRALAQLFHPDKERGDEEKFKELKLAYEILIDLERRKLFDSTGKFDTNLNLKNESFSILSQIISNLLPTTNPETEDLVLKLKVEVNKLKNNAETDLETCKAYISNLKKIINKLKLKEEGENILRTFASNQLQQRMNELEQFKHRIEVCNFMKEILENYHYGDSEWVLMINQPPSDLLP